MILLLRLVSAAYASPSSAKVSTVIEHRIRSVLTHWGRDKMAAVSQTTLSNAFSWMKMLEFRLRFPKGPINNIPALVQIMAWRRSGDKPLFEPMMVSLLTHICVTRPQRVNVTTLYVELLQIVWVQLCTRHQSSFVCIICAQTFSWFLPLFVKFRPLFSITLLLLLLLLRRGALIAVEYVVSFCWQMKMYISCDVMIIAFAKQTLIKWNHPYRIFHWKKFPSVTKMKKKHWRWHQICILRSVKKLTTCGILELWHLKSYWDGPQKFLLLTTISFTSVGAMASITNCIRTK